MVSVSCWGVLDHPEVLSDVDRAPYRSSPTTGEKCPKLITESKREPKLEGPDSFPSLLRLSMSSQPGRKTRMPASGGTQGAEAL